MKCGRQRSRRMVRPFLRNAAFCNIDGMAGVVWCKPFAPENHQPDTTAYKGECSWHGRAAANGPPCPNEPFASVKIREDSGYETVWSACPVALRLISERYGFPIPPSA